MAICVPPIGLTAALLHPLVAWLIRLHYQATPFSEALNEYQKHIRHERYAGPDATHPRNQGLMVMTLYKLWKHFDSFFVLCSLSFFFSCSLSLFQEMFLFPFCTWLSQVRLYLQLQHAFHSSEHRNAPDKKEGGVLCSSLGWQTGGLFCVTCLDLRLHKMLGLDWWYGVGGKALFFGRLM